MSWHLSNGLGQGKLYRPLARFQPRVEELEPRLAPSNNTISWNGGNWFLSGVNYPWKQYAADFGNGGWGHLADYSGVQSDMATLGNEGVHFLRWWVFGDGRYDPLFDGTGKITGLDSQFFADLDTELQYAANNHIYLDLTVLDTSIMNTASFSGGVQLGGHGNIMTDSTVQQSFLDNALKPLLQHIAASSYKQNVLCYDIINEPEGDLKPLAWPLNFWGNGGAPVDGPFVQTFVKNCASYIHSYGGGAYATVGSAEPQFVSYWKGLGLDFYCLHYYPWMDFGGAAGSGLPTYASLNLDKPCVVEEFANFGDASYGLNDTNPQSANWYLNTIYNLGYAGELSWSVNSDTNWTQFQPVFTNWEAAHAAIVGPQAPPAVTGIAATDGVAADISAFPKQASMITQVVLTFNMQVTLDQGAIAVNNLDGNGFAEDLKAPTIDNSSGHSVVTVTFQYKTGDVDPVTGGSIEDGNYRVTVNRTMVHQVGSGQYLASTYTSPDFYRWFGDVLGDKPLGNADALQFRKTFGLSRGATGFVAAFDFDGGVTIGNFDALQFRKRFGTSPPLPTLSVVAAGPVGHPSSLVTIAGLLSVPQTRGAALPTAATASGSPKASMSAVDAFFQHYGTSGPTDVVPGVSVVSGSDATRDPWQSALDAAHAGLFDGVGW
jgi:hypothetical protein